MYCIHCGNRCTLLFGRYMPADGSQCTGPRRPYCEPCEQDLARAALDHANDRVSDLIAQLLDAQGDALRAQERLREINRHYHGYRDPTDNDDNENYRPTGMG